MKLLLSRMWPEPSKAQGSTNLKISNKCHENRFFVLVLWLSPQVCYLPCSVVVDALLENPSSRRHPW